MIDYVGTPESIGRAQVTSVLVQTPYISFHNPAAAGFLKKTRWAFGQMTGFEKFLSISDVQLEVDSVTGESKRGAANTSHDDLWSTFLSVASPLTFAENLGISLDLQIPNRSITTVNTGEPFRPEYTHHESETGRPDIGISLGKSWDSFSVGLGVLTTFSGQGETRVKFVPDSSGTKSSYQTIRTKVKPRPTFTLGSSWEPHPQILVALRYREKLKSELTYQGTSSFVVAGTSSGLPITFEGKSNLISEPRRLALGGVFGKSQEHLGALGWEVEWIQWSKYQPPYMSLSFPGDLGRDFRSSYPQIQFRSEWQPKVFYEKDFGSISGSLGFAYHRSILKTDLSTTNSNFIDPNQRIYSGGLKYSLSKDWGCNVAASIHDLPRKQIKKSGSLIGSPGYTVGGKIWIFAVGLMTRL